VVLPHCSREAAALKEALPGEIEVVDERRHLRDGLLRLGSAARFSSSARRSRPSREHRPAAHHLLTIGPKVSLRP
jgi:hypothetical protein